MPSRKKKKKPPSTVAEPSISINCKVQRTPHSDFRFHLLFFLPQYLSSFNISQHSRNTFLFVSPTTKPGRLMGLFPYKVNIVKFDRKNWKVSYFTSKNALSFETLLFCRRYRLIHLFPVFILVATSFRYAKKQITVAQYNKASSSYTFNILRRRTIIVMIRCLFL